MPANRRSIVQNAQVYASKGQLDSAIAEWKNLIADFPHDAIAHNSLGDLYLKKRQASKEAIASFFRAAEAFRAEGSALKAIAAFKKILKVDPSYYEVYRHLGDLNSERGLVSSAVSDYQTLAKFYVKEEKFSEALDIYRKMVNQDPSNFSVREEVAKLCLTLNRSHEALEVYLQLGRERSAQQHREEARKAYKAALAVDPSNREAESFLSMSEGSSTDQPLAGTLASASRPGTGRSSEAPNKESLLSEAVRRMNEREFVGAEAILSQLLSREPGDPHVCQLLARLHLKQGETHVALNEYQFLAGAAMRADDLDLAESLLQEFLESHPTCVPLLELMGSVYEKRNVPETAARKYAKALEVLLEHPDPEMPSLPAELYDKLKELDPHSPRIHPFTAHFEEGLPFELAVSKDPHEEPVVEPVAVPEVDNVQTVVDDVTQPVESPPEEKTPLAPVETKVDTHSAALKGEEEVETHFLLGKAYQDMGLLNEAVEEYRLSVTHPRWFLDSCLQLAACLKSQGMSTRAIACLEYALNDPSHKGEQIAVIRYELALLYEGEGLCDKALQLYETIPSLKDVARRIAWIKRGDQPDKHSSSESGLASIGFGDTQGSASGPHWNIDEITSR